MLPSRLTMQHSNNAVSGCRFSVPSSLGIGFAILASSDAVPLFGDCDVLRAVVEQRLLGKAHK